MDKKVDYGKWWIEKTTPDTYDNWRFSQKNIHAEFKDWLRLKDINSVLEIGCGNGYYGRETFPMIDYEGIDMSVSAIEYANENKANPNHCYLWGDYLKTENAKADLVFSHSVIDHIYDINGMVQKMIDDSNRWVYITAYNGYFPDMENHEYIYNDNVKCYNSHISAKEIKREFPEAEIDTFEDRLDNVTRIIIDKKSII